MIKAIFFDLFFTLINPQYLNDKNEYDVLGIAQEEWEMYAENFKIYSERALGKVRSEMDIINEIVKIMPYEISEYQKKEIILRREQRMKNALESVSNEILKILEKIKEKHIKICLISNADMIDCKHWSKSPLFDCFDYAVFSCKVGLLKPDVTIYEYAMEKVGAKAYESLFIGDGGSDELEGAKKAGMKTIFTEHLDVKSEEKRNKINKYADYHIEYFNQIIQYIDYVDAIHIGKSADTLQDYLNGFLI